MQTEIFHLQLRMVLSRSVTKIGDFIPGGHDFINAHIVYAYARCNELNKWKKEKAVRTAALSSAAKEALFRLKWYSERKWFSGKMFWCRETGYRK